MNEQLSKSLNDLIDETLSELEELRKSRFEAAEIKIEGPGDKEMAGKPANGELDAKKADDKDEDDEDKKEEAKEEAKEEKAEKTEKKEEKVPGEPDKESFKKKEEKEEDKKDDKDDKDPGHEKKEKEMIEKLKSMHKSQEEASSLMKTYVDEKIQPLEVKLGTILDLVNKLSEQPIAPKGATAKTTPLFKSSDEVETLSKAQVASKLFDLKKSGTYVDSMDVAKAEMGQDVESIIKKYKLS